MALNVNVHQNDWEGLLNGLLGQTPRVSDLFYLGCVPRICFPNKFSDKDDNLKTTGVRKTV